MGERISRAISRFTKALVAASGSTLSGNDVRMGEYVFGSIYIGTGISTLTFYAVLEDGTASAMYDGSAVTMSVTAGRTYPLPDACAGVAVLRIVPDADGSVQITLKG